MDDTPTITEDEWRTQRFSEEQLASARLTEAQTGSRKVTLKDLRTALEKYGPDGILDSAIFLPRHQFEELEELVRVAEGKQPKKWRLRKHD